MKGGGKPSQPNRTTMGGPSGPKGKFGKKGAGVIIKRDLLTEIARRLICL